MKVEDQVVSFELSKRLSQKGLKRRSLFVWASMPPENEWQVWHSQRVQPDSSWSKILNPEWYYAYSVAEIADLLPREVGDDFVWRASRTPRKGAYEVKYRRRHNGRTELLRIVTKPKLADAMAEMLLYLFDLGYVQANNL